MGKPLVVIGLCGSLRSGSFNMALLKHAKENAPLGVTIDIRGIGDLPHYNADIESPLPAPVAALKKAIEAADGILIATPEHNYSVPAVLKNALEWCSRPYGSNSFRNKPVAIMGASSGMFGSARAQYHLRQIFVDMEGHVLNRPEVFVANAKEKIDANGVITDEKTKSKIVELVTALAAWTEKFPSHS